MLFNLKDINYTNDTIKIAQDKLRDCDLNLMSLKKFSAELNAGFMNIENQVSKLDMSFKDINLLSSYAHNRKSSLTSSIDDSSDESISSKNAELLESYSMEELERTFIFVKKTENGVVVEDSMNNKSSKRDSLSSLESSCSDLII
jgi:hypothetical protein